MPNPVSIENRTVGILSNPQSGRMKNTILRIRRISTQIEGGIYREASDKNGFETVLDEFGQCQLDLLVIIGGDGTIHAILSYIFSNQVFSSMPMMAVIPAGTTNMTAKDLHASGKPDKVFSRLVEKLSVPGPYPCIKRSVLRIKNGDDKPVFGLFFGAGIIADSVKYSHRGIRDLGITGEKVSCVVLLRYLFFLLSGRSDRSIEDTRIHIKDNTVIGRDEDCLLIFATTLNRLLLGLHPYWGSEREAIHVTLVRKSPRRLWRSILPLLSGRGTGLSEDDGYSSHNMKSLNLQITGDFIIDGEVYSADKKYGAVHISAGETISVIDLST